MLSSKYRGKYIKDLQKLIRIPSRSGPQGGEEGELQKNMIRMMEEAGARVYSYEAADVPDFFGHPLCHGPDRNYGDRPVVIAEIGPKDGPALVIMAHSDTVPVFQPEEWTVDPFAGTIKDGRIYGLGASDDKWGLAAMVTLIRSLKEQYGDIPKRLIFASTIDEEHGVGNGLLLLMLKGIKGEAALYLDGAQMDICIGNLGGSILYLRPKDTFSDELFESHFEKIKQMCMDESKRRSVKFDGLDYFSDNWSRNTTLVVHKRVDSNGRFLMIGFYTLPGEDKALFYGYLTELVSEKIGDDISRYSLSCREPWFEPALSPGDAPIIDYMAEAVRDVTGERGKITTISKQDAFVFINHARMPVASFGVGTTEGKGAFHNPDECVEIEKAWQGCQVIYRAVSHWLEKKA